MSTERVSVQGVRLVWSIFGAAVLCALFICAGHRIHPDASLLLLICFSAITAGWKVKLPGVRANLSPNFLFNMQAILQRNPTEALVVAFAGTLVQTVWRSRSPLEYQRLTFNLGTITLSVGAAYGVRQLLGVPHTALDFLMSSLGTGAAYFVMNTVTVSALMATLQQRNFAEVWRDLYAWLIPIFALGTLYVGMVVRLDAVTGNGASVTLAILAIVFWRLYRLHLERVNLEKRRADAEIEHAGEVWRIQQRTIEALALAIDAKDAGTGQHIQRVRRYCCILGRALGMSVEAVEILDTAALLHDIGKLGIPDHILSKPSKLTPEEFDKIKTHPVVGAEILERVGFPLPIVPIVRHHHECWNGKGYPDGLTGTAIPFGARILAVVDTFDALTSKRHYRERMSVAEAFEYIESEAGKRFDPAVVAVLACVVDDMVGERESQPQESAPWQAAALAPGDGPVPANGWESQSSKAGRPGECVLSLIGAASHEGTFMLELASLFAGTKSLPALLPQVESRLRRIVPLDGMLVHRPGPEGLERIYGDSRIGSESVVAHWVWKHQRAVLNSGPHTASAVHSPSVVLVNGGCSLLSVPIRDAAGSEGVLTLVASQRDCFSADDLRILTAVAERLCPAIQNLDRLSSMAAESRLDPLTGAPNRRSLRERFDRSVQQALEDGEALSVMLCDIDRFKQVNDQHGHAMGDKVLQCVAELLRRQCCDGRYYARLGGDEFVLILHGTERKDWDSLRTELLEQLNECRLDFGLEQVRIELSIGFAVLSEEQGSCERLLDSADQAMYKEKQARRRPVVIAS